jgi:hypothetical protein
MVEVPNFERTRVVCEQKVFRKGCLEAGLWLFNGVTVWFAASFGEMDVFAWDYRMYTI